jgi:tetratricopeptide (TPR) repeat protein
MKYLVLLLSLCSCLQAGEDALTQAELEAGIAAYRSRDYRVAITKLSGFIAKTPVPEGRQREAVAALGLSYYFTQQYERAIPLLDQASNWNPGNAEFAYALALSHARKRNADGTNAAFARLFGLRSDSAEAYMITARFLMREQMDDLAEMQVAKAKRINSAIPQLHYLLGELANGRNDTDGAVKEFEAEISINPGFWMAHYRLGEALSKKQDLDSAIISLQKAIWLNPDFSSPYILLGRIYYTKKEFEPAAGMLKRAVTMDPNNPTARYLLGSVLRSLGRESEATQQFEVFRTLKK